jgi:NAD(P)-dependent dehydrogenase (short-subunit alcohol dehydrogenase family)
MSNLSSKTIVVTGSNGLIGSKLVEKLVEQKSNIIAVDIAYKNPTILEESKKINQYNQIQFIGCDILDEKQLEEKIKEYFNYFGSIDGLVNCAAIDFIPSEESDNSFENLDILEFQNILNINVTGQVLCSRIVGELMKKNNIKGSIVNINSIYGKVSPRQDIYDHIKINGESYKKPIVYSISKSALTNFTRYLATYWGKSGIRVNEVVFGGVYNNQDGEFVSKYIDNVPLGRMANIEECIGPITFLLSDESSYMTGSELIVDGGWMAW